MFIRQFLETYKWLLSASFFSALTVLLIKYYEFDTSNYILLVALLSECGLIYAYIKLLKKDDILTEFALVKIVAIMMIVLPSILYFGTKLTIYKMVGIILGMISIYMLK